MTRKKQTPGTRPAVQKKARARRRRVQRKEQHPQHSQQNETAVTSEQSREPTMQGMRQAAMLQLQQQHGNRYVQRVLDERGSTPALQRSPEDETADTAAGAAAKAAAGTETQSSWDAVIEQKIAATLEAFEKIPVTVTWEETDPQSGQKTEQQKIVYVETPYYINTGWRKTAAVTNRAKAKGLDPDALTAEKKSSLGRAGGLPFSSAERKEMGALGTAAVGKSTPEQISKILEQAVQGGKIKASDKTAKHPSAEDMRNWLKKYGIGVDCSGFVSQALNEVMQEVHGQAGLPAEDAEQFNLLNTGSGGLNAASKKFDKVGSPADLRPGDTMFLDSESIDHIRIVLNKTVTPGGIVFETAESRGGGKAAVGTDRAKWRYPDAGQFSKLQKWDAGKEKFISKGENVTFSRMQALEQFTAAHAPETPAPANTPAAPAAGNPAPAQTEGVGEWIGSLVDQAEQTVTDLAEGALSTGEALVEGITDLGESLYDSFFGEGEGESKNGQSPAQPSEENTNPLAGIDLGIPAMYLAIAAGERSETELTDIVFLARHPGRKGKPIDPKSEKELVNEWLGIRKSDVRPVLKKIKAAGKKPAADKPKPTPSPIKPSGGVIPKADMGGRSKGRAYMLDWSAKHKRIEQDGTLREAFLESLNAQIEMFFGEALTREEVLQRIQTAEAEGKADEAETLRANLFKANQYAVVEALNVEKSERYQKQTRVVDDKTKTSTYCNIYAYDVVTAMGGYIPRVWWNNAAIKKIEKGEQVDVKYGKTVYELNANALTDWMHKHGANFGWRKAEDMHAGQEAANGGKLVIILAARTNPRKAGHINVIMPETEELKAVRTDEGDVSKPLQSQAGGSNFKYKPHSSKWWAGKTYRDGGAWIFEGKPVSPLMTPEELGDNSEREKK